MWKRRYSLSLREDGRARGPARCEYVLGACAKHAAQSPAEVARNEKEGTVPLMERNEAIRRVEF